MASTTQHAVSSWGFPLAFPMAALVCATTHAWAAESPPVSPTPVAARPAGSSARRVLVMDFQGRGVEAGVAAQAAQLVADALVGQADLATTTMADVRELVAHEKLQGMAGCQPGAPCLADLARAAAATEVVSGTLGRVGAGYSVSLTLTDVQTAASRGQVTEQCAATRELPAALKRATEKLFGISAAAGVRFALPAGTKQSFAVLDVAPHGVSADVVASLTQVLSAELKRVDGASVLSRDDIQALLQMEELKSRVGCDEVSCLAELGGALGVDHLVAGSVGRLGDSYVISLRLISVRTVTVGHRVTETFSGPEDQLIRAMRHAGRTLVGVAAVMPGSLAVSSSEPAATMHVDGQARGSLPMKAATALHAGPHAVRVAKSGYFDWNGDVYVDPGETTALFVELKARPLKWYQRWWVWTIIAGTTAGIGTVSAATLGVAVASGFAVIRYAAAPAPDAGSGTATVR